MKYSVLLLLALSGLCFSFKHHLCIKTEDKVSLYALSDSVEVYGVLDTSLGQVTISIRNYRVQAIGMDTLLLEGRSGCNSWTSSIVACYFGNSPVDRDDPHEKMHPFIIHPGKEINIVRNYHTATTNFFHLNIYYRLVTDISPEGDTYTVGDPFNVVLANFDVKNCVH